jgi:phosphotransferase system HPr (HPr) family protein
MRFVDLASKYESEVSVTNVSRGSETVDGKSAMQMMLLEASKGSVLRIVALGRDAREAVSALEALVSGGFDSGASQQPE